MSLACYLVHPVIVRVTKARLRDNFVYLCSSEQTTELKQNCLLSFQLCQSDILCGVYANKGVLVWRDDIVSGRVALCVISLMEEPIHSRLAHLLVSI